MPAGETQPDRTQQHLQARFRAMGLSARPMPDGRSILVSLPIGPAPFESLSGPLVIERVVFSTIDAARIKCLRPRPVFGLPILDIRDAQDATAIEAVIRRAWRERTRKLRDARRWLHSLGIDGRPGDGGSLLGFPLPGESPDTQVLLFDRAEAILPSAGPLSGLPLVSREERVCTLDKSLESGADLECHVAARIDGVARSARRRQAEERDQLMRDAPAEDTPSPAPEALSAEAAPKPTPAPASSSRRRPKVLVVGQRLIENAALREQLARDGYQTATARSETEALMRLAGMTPDVVLSEFGLGRSDGATLVQATRGLAGIEGIPVVLLDDTAHASRREAARAVGAAGYVIGPQDTRRFVARLGRLIDEPGKRRYTRYPGRLAARLQNLATPCLATEVGRGGVFIATDADLGLHTETHGEIALPELGRDLSFEAEVLYRAESQGAVPGLGLRFVDLSEEDEAALIEYLTRLERER